MRSEALLRPRNIGCKLHGEVEKGGARVAVEADVKALAEKASGVYARILSGLEEYYRSDMAFGLLAERLGLPVRSLIEFMQKYRLPYKGGEGDGEKGLEVLLKLRRTVST